MNCLSTGLHVLWAWTPLFEPLHMDDYWLWFILPLAIGIAVVYKAIRMHRLDRLLHEAAYLATQIVVFMVLAAFFIWLVTERV